MVTPLEMLSRMATWLMVRPEMLRRSMQTWSEPRQAQSWSYPPQRTSSQFVTTVEPLKLLSIPRESSEVGNVVLTRMPHPVPMSVKRQSSIRLLAPP